MEKTSVIVEGGGEQCGGSLDTGSLPDIINAEGTDTAVYHVRKS